MEDDYKIYDECVAELDAESRATLNKMVENIQDNLRARRRSLRPTGLADKGAKEIIVSLIRKGWLPLTNTEEYAELQKRMAQWGQV